MGAQNTADRVTDALRLSSWVESVEGSSTVALNSQAMLLKQQGRDILNLTAGEPEFHTPEHIRQAAHDAIEAGKTGYTPTAGIPELRQAVAKSVSARTGREYAADQIVITPGAKYAIYLTAAAILEPGDEVLIPAPYWVSYPAIVRMFGGKAVPVWAGPEHDFKITPADLEQAWTPRTRGIIFNSPSNPTGAVYSRGETEAVGRWAQEKDVWVISDEIYAELRNSDEPYCSIASLDDDLCARTVVIDGVSKAYAMTGWRVGWLAAAAPLAKAAIRVQGQTTSNATSIAQWAALAAVEGPRETVSEMAMEFRRRRDFAYELLHTIDGLGIAKPEGAFYFFLDVREFLGRKTSGGVAIDSAEALCSYLLDSAGLAMVPGEGFGAPGFMRLSISSSTKTLEAAAGRLRDALNGLR